MLWKWKMENLLENFWCCRMKSGNGFVPRDMAEFWLWQEENPSVTSDFMDFLEPERVCLWVPSQGKLKFKNDFFNQNFKNFLRISIDFEKFFSWHFPQTPPKPIASSIRPRNSICEIEERIYDFICQSIRSPTAPVTPKSSDKSVKWKPLENSLAPPLPSYLPWNFSTVAVCLRRLSLIPTWKFKGSRLVSRTSESSMCDL